jgi:tetratricopeptide (TPR) repeat protein
VTVLVAAIFSVLLIAPPGDKVIDVRARQAPPTASSFDALWATYKKAESKGDNEGAQSAMREIRRLRIERNIRGLETVALARVADGVAALRAGENTRAETALRDAVALDPHLPDAYFGLALYDVKKGPLGIVPAVKDTLAGTMARLSTARGGHYLFALIVPVMLMALLASTIVFGLAIVIRYGSLLKHDFEESFGPGRQSLALGLAAVILLLPAMLFQGWAWLPLWWLAMLFIYMGWAERIVALALLLLCVGSAPLVKTMEARLLAQQNPLFWASLGALESGPDTRAVAQLEEARRANPADRDLTYLLGAEYKKAGRYDDASALYREALASQAKDPIALNNLANLEFAAGEFPAAIARYKQGIESGPPAPIAATFYYNQSLAHLQRFEYQPAQEARSQADRLDSSLVHTYDSLWKYDKGDYAVVDLGLTADEVWAKYSGAAQGVVQANRAGKGRGASEGQSFLPSLGNRLSVFPLIALLAVAILRKWRGGQGVHDALPEVRHALLPALPPWAGGGRPVLAVPSPVPRAGRRLRSRAQPEAARGAGGGGPPRTRLPRALPDRARSGAPLREPRARGDPPRPRMVVRDRGRAPDRAPPAADRRLRASSRSPGAWAWGRSCCSSSTSSPTAASPSSRRHAAHPSPGRTRRRAPPGLLGRAMALEGTIKDFGLPTSSSSSGCSGRRASSP